MVLIHGLESLVFNTLKPWIQVHVFKIHGFKYMDLNPYFLIHGLESIVLNTRTRIHGFKYMDLNPWFLIHGLESMFLNTWF